MRINPVQNNQTYSRNKNVSFGYTFSPLALYVTEYATKGPITSRTKKISDLLKTFCDKFEGIPVTVDVSEIKKRLTIKLVSDQNKTLILKRSWNEEDDIGMKKAFTNFLAYAIREHKRICDTIQQNAVK